MDEQGHRKTRFVSVIAATIISIGCGTNYAYSAWGPQLAERLEFTATQSNLIGTAGNLGMYAAGIPLGTLVDKKGPRPAALLGAVCLGVGYFPIRSAYDAGAGSTSLITLFMLSFLTGVGSCAAFSAALKTSALNWPNHRGTATAFPLAAFGLSAFFFTTISGLAFHDNTSSLLLLLSAGTFGMVLVSTIFLQVVDKSHAKYAALPTSESRGSQRRDSNQLQRTKSNSSKGSPNLGEDEPESDAPPNDETVDDDEASSLMSGPGDIIEDDHRSIATQHSHRLDISGVALVYRVEFWQIWVLLGLLTGAGLMTINNIGNDVQALWSHWDNTVPKSFIVKRQLMHVSILSVMSFLGRLTSGVGSDFLVKKFDMSRFWCVAVSGTIFSVAQLAGMKVENPNFLWLVSGLNGLAYGALFGVYPAIVADSFGVTGFSLNWGIMTLAPVVSGNIFNLFYGFVYDHHSANSPGGERECTLGLKCYSAAYMITLFSSVFGILVALWCIRHQHMAKNREKNWQDDHRES